jgi:hypothetical protein
VLERVDGAGGTQEVTACLTRRRPAYAVGFSLPGDAHSIQAKPASVPDKAWTPAYDADGQVRPAAWVAELNRRHRITAFATRGVRRTGHHLAERSAASAW